MKEYVVSCCHIDTIIVGIKVYVQHVLIYWLINRSYLNAVFGNIFNKRLKVISDKHREMPLHRHYLFVYIRRNDCILVFFRVPYGWRRIMTFYSLFLDVFQKGKLYILFFVIRKLFFTKFVIFSRIPLSIQFFISIL